MKRRPIIWTAQMDQALRDDAIAPDVSIRAAGVLLGVCHASVLLRCKKLDIAWQHCRMDNRHCRDCGRTEDLVPGRWLCAFCRSADALKKRKGNPGASVRYVWAQKKHLMKRRYGQAAVDHFVRHDKCERCGEERLACIGIHHVYGKAFDVFETLCLNCHAVHHGTSLTMEVVNDARIPA